MTMLDTCFLIDYQRESKRKEAGPAIAFLLRHPDERLRMSVVAWGEFLAGFTNPEHAFVQFARDKLEILPLTEEITSTYRTIYCDLKATGNLIGANDLWIAAHALALNLPLVSRNCSEFTRIPSLQLQTY